MEEIGSLLKEERESCGVSLEEASKDLDIKESALQNIESGCIGSFKDVHELKTIIYNYSKYLGLDPDKMVDKYNDYMFEYTSKIPLKEIEKAVNENKKNEEDKIVSPYSKEYEVSYKKYYLTIAILIFILIILSLWWARNQVELGSVSTTSIAYIK